MSGGSAAAAAAAAAPASSAEASSSSRKRPRTAAGGEDVAAASAPAATAAAAAAAAAGGGEIADECLVESVVIELSPAAVPHAALSSSSTSSSSSSSAAASAAAAAAASASAASAPASRVLALRRAIRAAVRQHAPETQPGDWQLKRLRSSSTSGASHSSGANGGGGLGSGGLGSGACSYDLLPPREVWRAERSAAEALAAAVRAVACVARVELMEWVDAALCGAADDDDDEVEDDMGKKHHRDTEEYEWSLSQTRVQEAWKLGTRGDGVRVAHPDTGFLEHAELTASGRVDLDTDYDFYSSTLGDEDAHDDDPTGGHGLATGSVIMSGEGYDGAPRAAAEEEEPYVSGVAPLATLVPMRVTSTRLYGIIPKPSGILLGTRRLRDAILYATFDVNCDVVSMSLGSPLRSKSLHRAIKAARDRGMILVAAAGNALPGTTSWIGGQRAYPASFPEVVSCAATDVEKKAWDLSFFGDTVDVAAPGHSVWRATNKDGREVVRRSSGTSYAVAHIAGVAALWLAHHGGREALMRRARKSGRVANPGRAVGDAFLTALRASCRDRPVSHPDHPDRTYGAGLVDTAKTIAYRLPW